MRLRRIGCPVRWSRSGTAARSSSVRPSAARKLADEPGLDGSPAPAEPMTEDTIFDLASLTKSVATATAFLQLYEKGMVAIDDPVQKYLPDFNPANDPRRAQVTVRMLLTHTSGIAGDLSLDGPWGLDRGRQGRRHSPCARRAGGVRSRRGVPLLRHQLHSAWRDDREDHRRAGGYLRAAERLCAARHVRHPLSPGRQSLRPASDHRDGDHSRSDRTLGGRVPGRYLEHRSVVAHRTDGA